MVEIPYFPQQCLYFLPLPQGQGFLRPTFGPVRTGFAFSISAAASDEKESHTDSKFLRHLFPAVSRIRDEAQAF